MIKKYFSPNVPLVFILLLASILRFYSYNSRWALAYDQAWFAIIGRYALMNFKLPLLGPFASGGPFQTGGEWFWIVMLGTLLNPFSVISPWILITLLSIIQVILMYFIGKLILNKSFGLLVALLCAVSTSQVLQATNLTSQMTSSICASIFLLGAIYYFKNRKIKYLFISGLAVGLSSAIHLQGALLVIPLVLFIFFSGSFSPKKVAVIFFGLLIPWVPVLIVDIQNNFYNTKNMLFYFLHPQSNITYEALGRRWLTFTTVYIPTAWGRIVGGNIIFGYINIFLVAFSFSVMFFKKKERVEWVFLLLSTVLVFISLRYIRTPLYENYITFIHPFVFLLVGYAIWWIFKYKKLGYFLVIIMVFFSVIVSVNEIRYSTNLTAPQTEKLVDSLRKKFPDRKFAIYDYRYKYTGQSLPLVLYLQTKGLIDDKGVAIGMAVATSGGKTKFYPHKPITGTDDSYQLFDLTASTSAQLGESGWAFVNPSIIYNSVENWYKK